MSGLVIRPGTEMYSECGNEGNPRRYLIPSSHFCQNVHVSDENAQLRLLPRADGLYAPLYEHPQELLR